jgi:ribonuclease Y
MTYVVLAAVLAAFVVGLLFVYVYRQRTKMGSGGPPRIPVAGRAPVDTAVPRGVAGPANAPRVPGTAALPGNGDDAGVHRLRPPSAGGHVAESANGGTDDESDAFARSARRIAEAEAASTRLLAQREADAVKRTAEAQAEAVTRSAEAEAAAALRAAHSDAATVRAAADAAAEEARRAAADAERSLTQKSAEWAQSSTRERAELTRRASELESSAQQLAERVERVERQAAEAEKALREAQEKQDELQRARDDLDRRAAEHVTELARIAGLSADDAKAELLRAVEESARRDAAALTRTIENEARTQATVKARGIIAEAVQRCASEQTTETVVSVLHLPSDEMKGRIIGREGRNIRSFESVTGVNVLIDDTPEAVLLSCFDPTRREIGRLTLERLVLDGRIHPHRIEEAYEQSKEEVEQLCLRAANDALADVGIADLDERLLPVVGRLRYRTSYGQNVLAHLVETAHIGGVMAAELGVDPVLVKRCAFLHDIGKALTHEVAGSHAIVGAELLRKYGESEAVAHAVEAHHDEVHPRTIEAVLTQAADACSASRPGARRETLENYVKRLARIEEIATEHAGVEKVFAMQAGREVRVMVQPDTVDDLESAVIARDIAKQIESELTFPGQIRVTVVRESRVTEVAH